MTKKARKFYLHYEEEGLTFYYVGQLQDTDGSYYHHFDALRGAEKGAYEFPSKYAAKQRRKTLKDHPKYGEQVIEINEFTGQVEH